MLTRVLELLDTETIQESAAADRKDASADREVVPGSQDTTAAAEQAIGPAPPVMDFATAARADFKILLVEDSLTLRNVLANVLRQRFRVLSAPDGWEGLRLLAERPDLILTEIVLPRVDGRELLRYARQISADVPVLAMYDPQHKDLLAAAQRLGVKHALMKPFRIADLVGRVQTLADSRAEQVSRSILVVCPDETERDALYHLFDTRYRTHVAASTDAAVALADTHFDLLVVDAVADGLSWQKVVSVFRKEHRYVKVVALTDGKDEAALGALRKAGVESAILRPYGFDDLLLRVQNLLGIKRFDERIFRSVFRKLA